MQRDAMLVQLRPKLNLPLGDSTPLEAFQNATLRPILKMLHAALLARLWSYFSKRKIDFSNLADTEKRLVIATSVRKDQLFRQSLAGMVIGHFTEPELDFFVKNESAVMRRIVDLTVQRLQSIVQTDPE
jgi:hypothetical protein